MNYNNPPARSLASRFPALKSRETCRGFVIYQNRVVWFESHLELMAFFMLALLPEVATIQEQPNAVTYQDGETFHHHTFDFLVIFRDGRRKYVAVKAAARVASSRIEHVLGLIAAQLPPALGASVHLITDADFTYADRFNAIQAFDFCMDPVKEHDEAMTRLVSEITGAVRIADLVAASGLGAMGFRSVIRLIAYRQLAAVKPGRVTYDTFVRPFETAAAPIAIAD
ncbi:hypothetical protein AB8A31_04575 [Tardiphaga sp. 804_B3_N1_9]|uniref:hypothetical protein n=1 Tax=Tardiphaga sp. 804_B3_N1_9 TaxID=3240786 RepID=UPI003F214766